MNSDLRIGDELPAGHRGPPVLVVLAGFVALVAGATGVIVGLTSLARLLDRLT